MRSTLAMLGTMLCLLGCSTLSSTRESPIPIPATKATQEDPKLACLVWKPIAFDRLKDTTETILEVKASNAARKGYCG